MPDTWAGEERVREVDHISVAAEEKSNAGHTSDFIQGELT
jgi:hypothetical protein